MLKRPLRVWVFAAAALASSPAFAAPQAPNVAVAGEDSVPSHANASEKSESNGAATKANSEPRPTEATPNADAELAVGRELFWLAYQKFNDGDYQGAALLFEQSYAIYPQHEVLFNMALANARGGRCREAHDILATYREQHTQEKDSEQVASQLETIDAACSAQSDAIIKPAVAPTPGVTALVSTTAPAGASDPAAGPPSVVGSVPSKRASLVTEAGGRGPSVALSETSYWTTQTVTGWALVGAAIASSGVAIYFGDKRSDAKSEIERINAAIDRGEEPTDPGRHVAEFEQDYQQGSIGLAISAVVAGGCAVTGAALLAGFGAREASDDVQVGLGAGPQLSLSGRF
ncbi:MAG TPA: hypothetical protein VFU02_12180 [Polyangiaceae bacterium]|nr:hypothetical protein [Polyangiaceae bacterium]